MNPAEVDRWFAAYLDGFAQVARGHVEVGRLLQWYAVPLIITVDDGTVVMGTADEVLEVVGRQITQLRAEGFVRSIEVNSVTTQLNASSTIRREGLTRQRSDGTDIDHVDMTYVIVATGGGYRIALMAVHNARVTDEARELSTPPAG